MKKIDSLFAQVACVAFLVLGVGCGSEMDSVDFSLNGETHAALASPDDTDTSKAFKIFVGDSIHFVNVSSPGENVETLKWLVSRNGEELNLVENANSITKGFTEEGLFLVQLCVNGTEHCVTKSVLVQPTPTFIEAPIEPETEMPTEAQPSPSPLATTQKPTGGSSGGQSSTLVVPSNASASASKPPSVVSPQPVVPPPPPTPTVEASPTPPKEKAFSRLGTIGGTSSTRKAGNDCIDTKQTSFSVTLKPTQPTELNSFIIFTEGCGGLKLTLQGGDLNERATVSLTKGKNQVSLAGMDDTRLEPGNTYTLSGTAIAKYGNCQEDRVPHLEDASDCGLSVNNSPLLEINQRGTLILFDFKFSFQ